MVTTVVAERVAADIYPAVTVRARAPLRISFAGGGTDLPHYYEAYGGAVLSSTIDRFASVTVSERPDQAVCIRSSNTGQVAEYDLDEGPVYDGVHDLVKAAIQRIGPPCGLDVEVHCDMPAGSGLGGSSALTAAALRALCALVDDVPSRYELAELNYRIERHDLGIPGGKQDQYAATFGGFNLIEFSESGVLVDRLRLDPVTVEGLAARLLLCYTGGVRVDTNLVDRHIRLYREGRRETLEGTRELHRMAYAMREVLVAGRLDEVGELLHTGYLHKKRMNPYLTEGTPADLLYDTARRSGAIGGKLCGAGGGGYLVLYCPVGQRSEVRRCLEQCGGRCLDVTFDDLGARLW